MSHDGGPPVVEHHPGLRYLRGSDEHGSMAVNPDELEGDLAFDGRAVRIARVQVRSDEATLRAVGLSGKDGGLMRVTKVTRTKRDPDSNIEKVLDLGFVGEPVAVLIGPVADLLAAGEGAGKDHPRFIAQRFRQQPAIAHLHVGGLVGRR